MEFNDDDKIKATILYHLRRKKVIGGVHTPFDTITKGFPSHIGKDVKKIAEKLIKDGYLLKKMTNNGLHIILNKDKLKEIEDFIKRILNYTF
ncbi:MAG: hypothetical protein KKB79_02210 [Nanoarchaeota archaeon]|nr:hypothetical protein [Nanoarchaeota archaeon]